MCIRDRWEIDIIDYESEDEHVIARSRKRYQESSPFETAWEYIDEAKINQPWPSANLTCERWYHRVVKGEAAETACKENLNKEECEMLESVLEVNSFSSSVENGGVCIHRQKKLMFENGSGVTCSEENVCLCAGKLR